MFINSGVADCESLQNIYGPQVEENKADSVFLKKAISVLKMMKCTECEAYFKASDYAYKINPTADAAVGVAMMQYKKGNFEDAVKYFDEALTMETDDAKKAEIAYAAAGSLLAVKKYVQAKSYCQKAISFNDKFGEAYILLAQAYGSNPNWSDEPAMNKCTYFVVLDKLAKAKAVDPSVAEKADELIATYRKHTPETKDLFMLGIKAGDRVTVGGWIGESTTVR
jgi:tetratricopeptide (TPR) repeat protein